MIAGVVSGSGTVPATGCPVVVSSAAPSMPPVGDVTVAHSVGDVGTAHKGHAKIGGTAVIRPALSGGTAPAPTASVCSSTEAASSSFWSTKESEKMQIIEECLAKVRGAHIPLAEQGLEKARAALAQSRHRAMDPAALVMRQVSLADAARRDELRTEAEGKRLQNELLRANVQKAREEHRKAKAEGKEAEVAAALALADKKVALAKAKKDALVIEQRNRELNTLFAATTARRVREFFKDLATQKSFTEKASHMHKTKPGFKKFLKEPPRTLWPVKPSSLRELQMYKTPQAVALSPPPRNRRCKLCYARRILNLSF